MVIRHYILFPKKLYTRKMLQVFHSELIKSRKLIQRGHATFIILHQGRTVAFDRLEAVR